MKINATSKYKIYLDCSLRETKVVRLFENGVDGWKLVADSTGDDLISMISDLLKNYDIRIQQLTQIEFNPGPGSFTGLRISAAVANVLNWSLGLKSLQELTYPSYGLEPNIHDTPWLDK